METTLTTYTTAQVHRRLDIPKPTIRNWTAEYAAYLSNRAQPDGGKTRLFTRDDLVVLNTVRYLTRVEGLNNNDLVRQALEDGRRVTELPEARTPEEDAALGTVDLVPLDRLERVLDQLSSVQDDLQRVEQDNRVLVRERDHALIALDAAQQQLADLREERGRLRGALAGLGAASIGLTLLNVVAILSLLLTASGPGA